MDIENFDINSYGPLGYEDLQALVEAVRAEVGAAELHGMLTAELCVAGPGCDVPDILADCIDLLGEGIEPVTADRQELCVILMQTLEGLEDSELQFGLLLPDDDSMLSQRTVALAQWCQGFMYAFALAEKKHNQGLSKNEEVAEILQDFAAISAVDGDAFGEASDEEPVESPPSDEQEEDEQDLMQLLEYVRVAAMNVFAQCHADADSAEQIDPVTLH